MSTIEITANPEAPEELQQLAEEYWSLAGVDEATGEVLWSTKTTELDFLRWAGSAHIAAAAGAIAVAPDYSCTSCGNPLILGSRQTLSDAQKGRRAICRSCRSSLESRAAEVLNPLSQARRAGQQERAAQRAQSRAEEQDRLAAQRIRDRELAQARHDAILTEHPTDESPADVQWRELRERVAGLAIIHAAENPDGLIHPVSYVDGSIAPSLDLAKEALEAAWRSGILRIHPSSPVDAFIWEDEDSAVLGGSWYPERARFFTPGSGPLEQRLADTASALRRSLQLTELTRDERDEVRDYAEDLVVGEAIRYFRSYLGEHNLPDPADHHWEALETHTRRGAREFALGHLYRMIWSCVRDASSAHERNRGMTRENASTHAVNQFARWIQRAVDDPSILNEPYRERHDLPLSHLTDVVFRVILGVDPMSVSPAVVQELLGRQLEEELDAACDARIPERSELLELLHVSRRDWDDDAFRSALAEVVEWRPAACSSTCAHVWVQALAFDAARLFDRIATRAGSHVGQITAESTLLGNSGRDCRPGDLLLSEITKRLGLGEVDSPS